MARVEYAGGVFVSVEGRRWFVRECGEGEPVVLFHGIPTSSFLWRKVLPILGRERRAIAPDLFGFGRSDKPVYGASTVTDLAEQLTRLLDRLQVERCALVGHDAGALVAVALLERWPERVTHLVVTNTSFRPERWRGGGFSLSSLLNRCLPVGPSFSPQANISSPGGPSVLSLLRIPLLGDMAIALAQPWMLRRAMRPFLDDPSVLDREALRGYWEPFELGFRRTLVRLARQPLFRADDLQRWREVLAARCGEGGIPLFVAWGARDPQFRVDEAEELAQTIAGAHFLSFVHASHFLPEERPRALGRAIAVFLERPAAVPVLR
ncbi:MAG: alpha/beta fold hydrolase [Thermomicrobium sp.]